MSISQVLSLLSGIALFLFGMSLMGDGLKKASGDKLEPILYRLTGTLPKSVLLGTFVTAVIQSSSATAVMVVGFVNSKMMKLRQGIGIILGAILGTSITGWVICLSYIEGAGNLRELISTSTLTSLVAIAGILLRMLSKDPMKRNVGDIMLGFSILMFGMSSMSGSVSDLGKQPWFIRLMGSMSNPVLGILCGAVFTALLQSASAAVGIVQALSVTGAMDFAESLPLLMGISFGASAPVVLAALGAGTEGRRTAFVYPVATGLGTIVTAVIFYIANAVVHFPFMTRVMNPFSMAFVNTVLRCAMMLLLLPLVGFIEKTVIRIVPEVPEESVDAKPRFKVQMEDRFLQHPALAIEQSRNRIREMAEISRNAVGEALSLFGGYDRKVFDTVTELEDKVDVYEDALGTYLVKIIGLPITPKQQEDVSIYLNTLSDCERISDHALNLAENAKELEERAIHFSGEAAEEIEVISSAVREVVDITVRAFVDKDLKLAEQVEPLEQVIDELCDTMKLNHVSRLQRGECTIGQGYVFHDMLTNCERISDHCSNIAIAMMALHEKSFDTHMQLGEIKEKHGHDFQEAYYRFRERYFL